MGLAIRLHGLGLLPEQHRRAFVATVIAYAIEGDDLYALDNLRIQSVFTAAEISAFRVRVRTELVPNLSSIRRNWQRNRNSDEEPDEHIGPLLESFSALKGEFADNPAILRQIDFEIAMAKEWIAEQTPEDPEEDRSARAFGDVDSLDHPPTQARSIFDGVDE